MSKVRVSGLRLLLAMAVVLVLGLMTGMVTAKAADSDVESVTVSGTCDYDKAYEVLKLVNQQRKANGLSELTMDKDLLDTAMLRAAETCVYWDHTRPDGTSCFTAGSKMYAENIAAGQTTADGVMSSWMNSSGHKKNILGSGYTTIGIGCFINNGVTYWVQNFGYGSAATLTKPANKTGTYNVNVLKSNISNGALRGALQNRGTMKAQIYVNNGFVEGALDASCFNWTSGDNSIATVSNGVVTGKKNGTVNITAALKTDSSIYVTMKATISGMSESSGSSSSGGASGNTGGSSSGGASGNTGSSSSGGASGNTGSSSSAGVLTKTTAGWKYIKNGVVDTSYTGLVKYNNAWWYVKSGSLDRSYTGLVKYNNAWWYVKSGRLDRSYKGLVKYNNAWWYVKSGRLDRSYTGLVKYNNAWWYVKKGRLDRSYTGLVKYNKAWWYVKGGRLDNRFTGNVKYNNAWWKVKNGRMTGRA